MKRWISLGIAVVAVFTSGYAAAYHYFPGLRAGLTAVLFVVLILVVVTNLPRSLTRHFGRKKFD